MSLDDYRLEDRYRRDSGRVFLTGTQALVRLPLMQRRLDRAAGLNTAGFISGYRGSPMGAYDRELWRAQHLLDDLGIRFLPAVNEELAATAVLGSQQVESDPRREVDGVFGIWYGKGPGVDRAGDALKHGNAYGSSPHGGVLVVAGDDHGAVSSSMPHQSDVAFLTFFMPQLNPADVGEYLSYGLYGFALSRFSGCWVGFKAVSETVESARSIELPEPPRFLVPDDFEMPPDGLHYRWPDLPGPQIEERLLAKKAAALAFAEANPIDRRIFNVADARFGIVTTGKGHHDLMEALRLLGIDRREARRIGLDVYKVGMVWPLARDSSLDFVRGKREVLVVEEKRGIIESWLKEYFYDYPGRKPERMVGKADEQGNDLIPWVGELTPLELAPIVAARIDAVLPGLDLGERARALEDRRAPALVAAGGERRPYFCSGCPHNTSTLVPDGSEALAGIGCHFMASWMDRDTGSLIQMGGEGVNWVARSLFNGGKHIFQNLGEGTFYHSGSVALRQAVAAGTNITYKILYNDAVAMTGGQPIDGPLSVQAIAHGVRAEGVERIALVSDDVARFTPAAFPSGTTLHDRAELDAVQRQLRDIPGVTVLIYDQACAAEKRRRRKRGKLAEPEQFVAINDLVCEGCGDCSAASNCLSVVPMETWLGRKRRIDQNSCNADYSCRNGFCPSFVTVSGARRRRPSIDNGFEIDTRNVPPPALPKLGGPYDLLVAGVGGTGVVTVSQLIAMAAHLEGKGVTVLDHMGFAQKFGTVLSHLRLAADPDSLNQVQIGQGSADALIGCDLVAGTAPKAGAMLGRGTRAVVNTAEMPTAEFVLHRDATVRGGERIGALAAAVADVETLAANRIAERYLGDTLHANVVMLGFAWQHGLVPVSRGALMRAVELNGAAVETNRRAFDLGRIAAADPDSLSPMADEEAAPASGEALEAKRLAFLTDYQDASHAERYRRFVAGVGEREQSVCGKSGKLTEAVAASYFKLLTSKDEYEVARLHAHPAFRQSLKDTFEGPIRLTYHLAPPFLSRGRDARGRPLKIAFGPWMGAVFRILARLRRLRGTPFDPFGRTAERRMERALVTEFEAAVGEVVAKLTPGNRDAAVHLARLPLEVRGFGPVKEEAVPAYRDALREGLRALDGPTADANGSGVAQAATGS